MSKWKCTICGWIYDPEIGLPEENIEPGIAFENLDDGFRCPPCGAMKKWFEVMKDA